MSINVNDKNLGHATAYAYYKAGGGTMTEAEFTEFMADFGTASQTAVEAAQAALASETAAQTAATTATNKASEATTAATTATTKAGEASTSASTATSAKDTAVSASQTATTKATEATTAAATATSAKTDAVAANTAAQSAKTAAQTAQTSAETAAASVEASAEQIATNAADISQLKSNLNDAKNIIRSGIIYTSRMAKSGNLFPFREDVIDGKYYSISNGELVTQTNANFYGFILAVNPNTEYHCTFARFLCLLDANKTPIAEMQSSTTNINTGNAVFVAISFNKTTYPIENYGISLGSKTDRTNYKIELPWLFSDTNTYKMLPNGISVEAENPAANSTLIACDYSNNVKYNKSYVYMAKFVGTIGNITIYHGSGTYSTYLRVTPTNIIVNTSGTDIYNETHQLTIADYLYIFVDTDDQNGAVIRVMSNGKLATVNITNWQGWQGQIFALTTSALTYHRLDILFKDCNASVWIFGDSYLSKTSNERWAYYLKQWGIDNYMAVGYPGAGSSNIYPTLENMLNITQPKFIVWTLGMNDPDTSEAINTNWLNAINKITALCEKYDITLILAKIPNANGAGTLYNHSFKNAWIEASGYRFIDVPSAVGANASGNWYTDLLASDGIHPTWRGAEAIAYQYLADVPELMITA